MQRVNTNLTACVMAPLVHKDITLLSRTVRHQCLYPLHWKLAAVHSLFLNLKNKKNKHKKQQCIDKHLWLNPIRYLYINSVYPAGSFVPELVSDTRYNVLVYVCAHLLEVFREKKDVCESVHVTHYS